MHFVNQRTDHDCGIACIAMAAGVAYELVESFAEPVMSHVQTHGMSDGLAADLLRRLGAQVVILSQTRGNPFVPEVCRLVAVPSINHRNGHHFVYWDGEQVSDPQAGREGKRFYAAHPRVAYVQALAVQHNYSFDFIQIGGGLTL